VKTKGKAESSASEDDDLADSSEEDEELDSESDDEHTAKRNRLKKSGKAAVKSSAPSSRPPLAPVKSYSSIPLQAQQLSNTTPAQKQSTSVYDRCSAQKTGSSEMNSNHSTPCSSDSPASNSSTPSMLVLPEGVVGRGSHEHNSFDFLQPAMRKDKDGNRPDSPRYNPRTCFVPQSFILKQTPAMAQWWILKQDNMDTVLFFKVKS
jgi:DNA mismatch repair protein MSH6